MQQSKTHTVQHNTHRWHVSRSIFGCCYDGSTYSRPQSEIVSNSVERKWQICPGGERTSESLQRTKLQTRRGKLGVGDKVLRENLDICTAESDIQNFFFHPFVFFVLLLLTFAHPLLPLQTRALLFSTPPSAPRTQRGALLSHYRITAAAEECTFGSLTFGETHDIHRGAAAFDRSCVSARQMMGWLQGGNAAEPRAGWDFESPRSSRLKWRQWRHGTFYSFFLHVNDEVWWGDILKLLE